MLDFIDVHHPVCQSPKFRLLGQAPGRGRTVQVRDALELSAGTNVAAKATSLLSRRAATDRSHGRQPVGGCRFEPSPRGAKDSQEICRPSGAHRRIDSKATGLRQACARGYDLSPRCGSNRMRFALHLGQQSLSGEGWLRDQENAPKRP